MTWRRDRQPVAPFLAAWYLALTLLGEGGWGQRPATDTIGTIVFATLTALGAWLVTGILDRKGGRRAIVSTVLVVITGLYGTLLLLSAAVVGTHGSPERIGLFAWIAAVVLILLLGARLPAPSSFVSRSLTAGLWALFGIAVAQQGWAQLGRGDGRLPDSTEVIAQQHSISDRRTTSLPDIYIIVLDKLGRGDLLAQHYNVSLATLEDSLRRLDFTVPRAARTNYVHTHLVLATLFNWQLVHEVEAPDTEALISEAALWTELQSRGYRFAFFPTGFPATSRNSRADILLSPPSAPTSQFGQTWRISTPFTAVVAELCQLGVCGAVAEFPYPIEDAASTRWKLAALETLPDSAGPIVAFLHLLATHEPYIFERDCTPREPWWPRTDAGPPDPAARAAYADQVTCVSGLVLEAVSTLIARSAVPPVIILQSDHGHGRIAVDPVRGLTLGINDVSSEQIEERLGVFAAYRFPGADSLISNTITPVNVFPIVLDALFGSSLPRSADRSFWSTYREPYTVTEVPQ